MSDCTTVKMHKNGPAQCEKHQPMFGEGELHYMQELNGG